MVVSIVAGHLTFVSERLRVSKGYTQNGEFYGETGEKPWGFRGYYFLTSRG